MPLSRRLFVLAAATALVADPLAALARKRPKAPNKPAPAAPVAAPPKVSGTPLPIPRLIEPAAGEALELTAAKVRHEFQPGKPVEVSGYGGTHLGPTIRLNRGRQVHARLANSLDRPTNLHWHGLLIDSTADGALTAVAPGASWETDLAVDQPAATLWYHAHLHGSVAKDVMDGLAGMVIVDDDASRTTTLPSAYGVDDFPLILQDKTFDATGKPVYEPSSDVIGHGFRGKSIVVNGIVDPMLKVPQRLVRLRLLNAANARIFRVYLEDERPFQIIAGDGGYLGTPAQVETLVLGPGERAEIVVDFADGSTSLMSTPDIHEHRSGAHVTNIPDTFEKPFRIIAFEAVKDASAGKPLPAALPAAPPPAIPDAVKRRRFVLEMGPMSASPAAAPMPGHDMSMPGMDMKGMDMQAGPRLTINGKSFDPARIDETVTFGATEIWEIVSPQMAHTFHIHGAQFHVLSEDGNLPRAWNRAAKDTVLVENSAEVLVTFPRHAPPSTPFLYHCHMLEHEDAGMMGTLTVV